MRVISYSLFNSNCQRFEKFAYLRLFYLNCRINNLIFPDPHWTTHLEVEDELYNEYKGLFDWLQTYNLLKIHVNFLDPLCKSMLWRMRPIFNQNATHVLCRDADALGSYREAIAVQQWLESGEACLSLHDNQAHGGLMGGMVGFDTAKFKAYTGYQSWEQMVKDYDLSKRGSDQHLLNQRILPKIQGDMRQRTTADLPGKYDKGFVPDVDQKLWTSNLIPAFIGCAGFNEFECIRFLRANDWQDTKYHEIEKEYRNLFYWWL